MIIDYKHIDSLISKGTATQTEILSLITVISKINKYILKTISKNKYNINKIYDTITKISQQEHIENIYIKEISPYRHVYVDILSLFIKANISIIEYDNVKYTGGSTRDKFSIFAAFFINHLEQNKIIKKIDNYSLSSLKLFDKYQLPYNFWYKKTPEEIFNKLQTHTTIINNSKYNNLYKLFDNIYSKAYNYGDTKNFFTSDEKNEGLETFIDIIHRLKEYEDLGTVSELIDLKCRYDIIKHGEELQLQ